jgi:Spy/CpxP family protein refolding chaperone
MEVITMKKYTIVTTLVIMSIMFAMSSFAQPYRSRDGGQMMLGGGHSSPCINLSQAQLTSMNSLQTALLKETLSLRSDITAKKFEMQRQLLEAAPDEKKAMQLQKEISALKAQMSEKSLSYQFKARKLLTPEQISQLPPGCNLQFGKRNCGLGLGTGPGYGMGSGYGMRQGYGWGRGRCWQ